jgi:hypothetical protein
MRESVQGQSIFLQKNEYIRIDVASDCADPDHPNDIGGGNWPALFEEDIDAVCIWLARLTE